MGRPGRTAAAAGPPGGALLLGVLGLFAGAAHGGGLPAGWEAAPVSVAEFPTGPCGVILADPWSYEGRLGMYKTLMGATPALAWDGGRGHPLWGLPLQFAWQHDSGRLLGEGEDEISKLS